MGRAGFFWTGTLRFGRAGRSWFSAALIRGLAVIIAVNVVAAGAVAAPASAAPGDVGTSGPVYSGVTAPTGEKPESKLWFNDGRWWASMYSVGAGAWHIFYLDRGAVPKGWRDTGVEIDSRPNTLADALWSNGKLYVASHVKASSNTAVVSGQPARLFRFSYDPVARTYALDAGFPVAINNTSSETLTLDRDTTGRLWATWTEQRKVYVNASITDAEWGTPFVLPVAGATVDPDDISTLVSFGQRIGVMWSAQNDSAVYFTFHANLDPVGTWAATRTVTVPGGGQADDHLNIKELQSDPEGRVFAVIKTSLENSGANSPLIVVLARSASGEWSRATFGRAVDCHTRPILMLDSSSDVVRVYATAPDSGCPFTGTAGTIFEKTSPMDNLAFPTGRGTPVMRDAASPHLNNVTGTKQGVDVGTGLVLLASNDVAGRYWFSDESLVPPPTANFSVDPGSGVAPLNVQFSDTSTGSPTQWSWDFGDGATSTGQQPSHTYQSPGTYTVSLTVSNASGSNTRTAVGAVVVAAPVGAVTVQNSTTAFADTATSAVTLGRPAGTAPGDLLVVSVSVDRNPSMVAVPSGWTALVNGLSINSSTSGGARLFVFYRRMTASEPDTYTWTTSSAVRWGGGMTAYRGVDPVTPLSAGRVTAVDASYLATSITLPSLTTGVSGSMLIGGVALDSATPGVSQPSGWAEDWEAAGGQIAEQASRGQSSAGPTGSVTWSWGTPRAAGGWFAALRPAS